MLNPAEHALAAAPDDSNDELESVSSVESSPVVPSSSLAAAASVAAAAAAAAAGSATRAHQPHRQSAAVPTPPHGPPRTDSWLGTFATAWPFGGSPASNETTSTTGAAVVAPGTSDVGSAPTVGFTISGEDGEEQDDEGGDEDDDEDDDDDDDEGVSIHKTVLSAFSPGGSSVTSYATAAPGGGATAVPLVDVPHVGGVAVPGVFTAIMFCYWDNTVGPLIEKARLYGRANGG